ncbi:Cation channel sperm-associated protein 2 [Rhizoctonia solani]|uniref:Cation channel sperm-associated protein 2 n=1 Tax=Rhizoctonia solani TaxID=456999 RepID=A0A0K6G1T7_9AGAM|nr:Cation channel sperm-associated protein 2 [Rhizoctonia solani]
MRVKQLWNYVPLPQSLKLVWDRLTFSRITTIYFTIALIHCFIQVVLQIAALYVSKDAAHVLTSIAAIDPDTPAGYAVLSRNGPLRACTGMPGSTGSTGCQMVWAGRVAPDAFGEYESYSYSQPPARTTATILTSSSPSSTARRTSIVVVTASASSATSNLAVQTRIVTASSSSVVRTLSQTPAPAISTASPTIPADSTRAKRMYIPSHTPGFKRNRLGKRDIGITPVFSQFNGTFEGVRLRGLTTGYYDIDDAHEETNDAFVSGVCVHSLQWPLQRLWNTQREDAVFIGFQFWVLGMSIVALLNESVPHIIAAFLTHLLTTGWSIFQLAQTAHFRSEFNRLTTHGACGGVNLLPFYWKTRMNIEIPTLVLNGMVLLGSAYMSWKLLKTFGWLTFKRVGASLEINRIYRVVLCLAIVLQLSLYFMVVSMALWIQELYVGPAAKETARAPLYKALVGVQVVALVPWLVMGWYAVRREMRKTMVVFLVLSALFVVAWAAMFVSTTWRLTFLTWMFFRMMTVCAAILTMLALILGIVCFLNFGKDLPKHLRINDDTESVADFLPAKASENSEKVDFPVQNTFPSFSAAFLTRSNSMSSHTRSASASSAQSNSSVVPPRAVHRLPPIRDFEVERPTSPVRESYEQDLARVLSNASSDTPTIRSTSSVHSTSSDNAADTNTIKLGKRWMIE